MVFFYGFYKKIISDIWGGTAHCPKCGETTHHHLKRSVNRVHIFYIPFMSTTEKRLWVCDKCDAAIEMTKADYNNLKKQQEANIKNFPPEIVREDFTPKKLKLVIKIIFLILMGLFILSSFTLLGEEGAAGAVIMMDSMFGIPFVFLLLNFIKSMKKYLVYKSVPSDVQPVQQNNNRYSAGYQNVNPNPAPDNNYPNPNQNPYPNYNYPNQNNYPY